MENNSHYEEFNKVKDTRKKSIVTSINEYFGFNQPKRPKRAVREAIIKPEEEIIEEPIDEELIIKEPKKLNPVEIAIDKPKKEETIASSKDESNNTQEEQEEYNPFAVSHRHIKNKRIKLNPCEILFNDIVMDAHRLDSAIKEHESIDLTEELKRLRAIIYELKEIDEKTDYEGLVKIDNKMRKLKIDVLDKIFKYNLSVNAVDEDKKIKRLELSIRN